MSEQEKVFCIESKEVFNHITPFEGLISGEKVCETWSRLIGNDKLRNFLPRNEVETNTNYLQIIPYIYITSSDGQYIFSYRRTKKGGDERLLGKKSIGVGGHINLEDFESSIKSTDYMFYYDSIEREIREEFNLSSKKGLLTYAPSYIVYEPNTSVGMVHLGFVHRFKLYTGCLPVSNEDSKLECNMLSQKQLYSEIHEYEMWSQYLIKEFNK